MQFCLAHSKYNKLLGKSEVEISTTEQWEGFIDAEQKILDSKAEKIIASGAKVLFCAESIDSRILHRLADEEIFILDNLERSGTEDLAKATGALMINHIDDLSQDTLGMFESLSVTKIDDVDEPRDRIYLEVGKSSGLSTIDVGGGGALLARKLYEAFTMLYVLYQPLFKPGQLFVAEEVSICLQV